MSRTTTSDDDFTTGLVFADGTRYNGHDYRALPWHEKVWKMRSLRDSILTRNPDCWSDEERDFVGPNRTAYRMASSWQFQLTCVLMIFANVIVTGVRVDSDVKNAAVYLVAENLFTAGFLLEWLVNLRAEGFLWLTYSFNVLDTLLVFAGIVPNWVLPIFTKHATEFQDAAGVLPIFRTLKILKVPQLLQRVKQRDLAMLMMGVMSSFRSFVFSMVLLCVFMYISAVLLRFVVDSNEQILEGDEDLQYYYGSVFKIMWFLFASLTNGLSWEAIAKPVTDVRQEFWVLYAIFTCIGNFILLNLVTAVIVEHAIDNAHVDAETEALLADQKKKKTVQRIIDMFVECDADNSGYVEQKEFLNTLRNRQMKRALRTLGLSDTGDVLVDLFHLVDCDGSNSLSLAEFQDMFQKIMGPVRSHDVIAIDGRLRRCEHKLDALLGFHLLPEAQVNEERWPQLLQAAEKLKEAQKMEDMRTQAQLVTQSQAAVAGTRLATEATQVAGSVEKMLQEISFEVRSLSKRMDVVTDRVEDLAKTVGAGPSADSTPIGQSQRSVWREAKDTACGAIVYKKAAS